MTEHPTTSSEDGGDDGNIPPIPATYPTRGVSVGEYEILKPLGQGSMATVYLARDQTGHEVALKLIQEGPGVSKTMLERFRREVEATKKLRRHPHIITIYSTGKEGPWHYIAMEPIPNSRTLEDLIESQTLSLDEIVRLGVKIAKAIHYANIRGIIHRDVKPTNVLVDEFGEPQLTDFGVAELVDWPSCTVTGALTGTPLYMSPEQARAEKVGPSSDIYSLAVVLYEAITGTLPYPSYKKGPMKEVLDAVVNEQPRRIRYYRKDVHHDLDAVIMKALEKDPARRYPDAGTFARDLERVISGRPVYARHKTAFDRAGMFLRRRSGPVKAAFIALILGGGLVGYFTWKLEDERVVSVLREAKLQNARYRMAGLYQNRSEEASPVWDSIRQARKYMLSRNWSSAAKLLNEAVQSSLDQDQYRIAAIALIEEARCETMMRNRIRGIELYKQVLEADNSPPLLRDIAQVECLCLAKLEGYTQTEREMQSVKELSLLGPTQYFVLCLVGNMHSAELAERSKDLPQRFENDGLFYAGVRYYLDGDNERAVNMYERCAETSSPPDEWPAVLALMLKFELTQL